DGEVGTANAPAGEAEPLECLRRGDLVDEVEIDVDQRRAALVLEDDVPLPDLLEEGLRHAASVPRRGYAADCRASRKSSASAVMCSGWYVNETGASVFRPSPVTSSTTRSSRPT